MRQLWYFVVAGAISTQHVSEMWRDGIMEWRDNWAHSLSSEPDGTMANANWRIKASPFRNMELFTGLTSILASWSVSACWHESCSLGLRNIVNVWAVDYTSSFTEQHKSIYSKHVIKGANTPSAMAWVVAVSQGLKECVCVCERVNVRVSVNFINENDDVNDLFFNDCDDTVIWLPTYIIVDDKRRDENAVYKIKTLPNSHLIFTAEQIMNVIFILNAAVLFH